MENYLFHQTPALLAIELIKEINILETDIVIINDYETNNKPPGEKVIEIQKQVLNLLGLDAEFAISCLNNVRADYPEDPELHQKMHLFGLCAQTATQESMMTPSQRKYVIHRQH